MKKLIYPDSIDEVLTQLTAVNVQNQMVRSSVDGVYNFDVPNTKQTFDVVNRVFVPEVDMYSKENLDKI